MTTHRAEGTLMHAWHIAFAANLIVGGVYILISAAILLPLSRSGQLRTNRLGLFTGLIFFSCAVGHAFHAEHYFVEGAGGATLKEAADWHTAVWDLTTAAIGLYYWRLRAVYSSLMQGAKLFEDLKARQRQALQLNDDVVQGLTAVQMALDLGEVYKAREVLNRTLDSATSLVSDLVDHETGTLVRDKAGSAG